AAELSGGEQQMLGLAQALLARTELLLVDELSLGLATPLVDELVARVKALNATGMTIVLADQALDVALALGGRALFLDGGELRFDGPIGELARRDDLLRPTLLGRAHG